ncbi:MAG: hypothetical protein AB7E81_04490 [Hyphomicrobiaceae bacterium]
MAHPYHHALSSVRKWGGKVEDYLPIHSWFDESKGIIADYRHRCLRHHAQGIQQCEILFGATITLSTGKVIPTRWVGEQHVREDLGRIPSFADWVRCIRPEPWMGRATNLSFEDAPADANECGRSGPISRDPRSSRNRETAAIAEHDGSSPR